MLLAVCHSATAGWEQIDDLTTLSELRATAGTLVWVEADSANLTPEDVALLADEFELHPLAVEDATKPRQRPKLEMYDHHIFLVVHQLDPQDGGLEPVQMSIFIGKQEVLTIHHGAARTIEATKERWRAGAEKLGDNPAALLHTLLDVLVDEYQEEADRLEGELEDFEDIALSVPNVPLQRQLYSLKQRTARLRRYALPVSRILDALMPLHDFFKGETEVHLRDVLDHTLRIRDQVTSVDDLSQAVLDLIRGEQAEALAVQGRKLSAWAAIFAVGTLVAGVYGMNFALVPDEGSLFGFWFAVGLTLTLGAGLFIYFKKRRWL
ncbi:MAG: magnesium transporter CorA family protein [Actinomycetota bacterium]